MVKKPILFFVSLLLMTNTAISKELKYLWQRSHEDWCYFAENVLGVNLDAEQQKIVWAVQHERKVSVRSGNARGKDYVAAVF